MVDILISGSEGKIEAKYHHNNDKNSPIILVLHPDPSRGGTMNSKIVFQLYKVFIENGFSVAFVGDRGFDFIAYQLTLNPLLYVVEVKYNKSRLTKLQKLFQYHCKKSKINYFVYRVTQDQLRYWLSERGVSF